MVDQMVNPYLLGSVTHRKRIDKWKWKLAIPVGLAGPSVTPVILIQRRWAVGVHGGGGGVPI